MEIRATGRDDAYLSPNYALDNIVVAVGGEPDGTMSRSRGTSTAS